MLYSSDTNPLPINQGNFRVLVHHPGFSLPGHSDHGYGPLALIAESYLDPDTWIKLHAHTNEEIISWVPQGVMRHDDPLSGELITDQHHLLIMNAGVEFWHEEKTLKQDPPLRMLQIFVRPYAVDLPPLLQHGALPPWANNQWRLVFGPPGPQNTFYVRNDIAMYDLRVKAGQTVAFPARPGYSLYFLVFSGSITVQHQPFGLRKTGLLVDEPAGELLSLADSVVVAFLINPTATITRAGTIGR